MAKKSSKIVLFKKGISGQGLAEASIKSAEIVDAVSIMQTDFVPEENTVQVNEEGGVLCANLTEAEAKSLASHPEVVDVVDDIQVVALDDSQPGLDNDAGGLDGPLLPRGRVSLSSPRTAPLRGHGLRFPFFSSNITGSSRNPLVQGSSIALIC